MGRIKIGTRIDSKKYLEICAGPLRGKRVHILVAEAMLGRKLLPDETIHHADGDKLNCDPSNLKVLDRTQHGFVSNRQKWFLKQKFAMVERQEAEWWRWIEEGGVRPDGVVETSDELRFEAEEVLHDEQALMAMTEPGADVSFNPEEGFGND